MTVKSHLEMGADRKHDYHRIDIHLRFGGDAGDFGFCPGLFNAA